MRGGCLQDWWRYPSQMVEKAGSVPEGRKELRGNRHREERLNLRRPGKRTGTNSNWGDWGHG